MKRYVLGVNGFVADLTGASIVCVENGEIIDQVAISEERLSRLKYDSDFPWRSIEACLKHFSLSSLRDIDYLAYDVKFQNLRVQSPLLFKRAYQHQLALLKNEICAHYVNNHHEAHAYASVFHSGFSDCVVLVLDGFGTDFQTATAYRYDNGKLKLCFEHERRGIGSLYSCITGLVLNFGYGGEGKTMGLAGYGQDSNLLANDISECPWLFDRDYSSLLHRMPHTYFSQDSYIPTVANPLMKTFPQRQLGESALIGQWPSIAASIQNEFEKSLLVMVQKLKQETSCTNLVLTGGCALNIQGNQMVRDSGIFEDVFVFPACSDTGIPYGNVIAGLMKSGQIGNSHRLKSIYWGPKQSSEMENIVGALSKIKIPSYPLSHEVVVDALSEGQVIGVIQGRSELGPRALGNRSIIANPLISTMRDHVNEKVKGRESWRPFAPITLLEEVSRYFGDEKDTPFMLFSKKVKSPDIIPSVVHIDNTARVQTVHNNELITDILTRFKEKTGHSVLLNTSFNLSGEPIVETALDGVITFLSSDLDMLVLNDIMLNKADIDINRQYEVLEYFKEYRQKYLEEYSSIVYTPQESDESELESEFLQALSSWLLKDLESNFIFICSDDELVSLKDNNLFSSIRTLVYKSVPKIIEEVKKVSSVEVIVVAVSELNFELVSQLRYLFPNKKIENLYKLGESNA